MGAFGRKSSSEVQDPRNSAFGPQTRVLQLFRAERTEMLQNTPKHRFGSNRGYWVRSGKKARRRFRTPETVHSAPKHEFCNFFVPNVPKCSKTLPNIVWSLTEVIGCLMAKKLVGGSGPPKHSPETRVLQLFRAERTKMLQNTPKHHFESNGCYWVCSGRRKSSSEVPHT